MFIKKIMASLLDIFMNGNFNFKNSSFLGQLYEAIQIVKKEMVSMSFRIVSGILLVAVIIFSLIQLSHSLNVILDGYVYGKYFELATYSLLMVLAIGAFIYLVHYNEKEKTISLQAAKKARIPFLETSAAQALSVVANFMDGYHSANKNYKRERLKEKKYLENGQSL